MKKYLLSLGTFIGSVGLFAQSLPSLEWTTQSGSTLNDVGVAVTSDFNGNVYTTGYFAGTADFDPGSGTANLSTDPVEYNIFIQKLDSTGAYQWAHQIGSPYETDIPQAIKTDANGNVLITGRFRWTVDFNPGSGTANLTSQGTWGIPGSYDDIFVLKLDSLGNYVWAVRAGGLQGDRANDMIIDANNNIITTGLFKGSNIDFDPGVGNAYPLDFGNNDIFIYKLNASGTYQWVKSYGSTANDQGNALVQDSQGNIYVVGTYSAAIDFEPTNPSNIPNANSGGTDIFILKLNSLGNFIWAKTIGGTGADNAYSVKVDGNDDVYVTGNFTGTVDFDPSTSTQNLISSGDLDNFVLKLTSAGNFVWAKKFGGTGQDVARDLAVQPSGNSIVSGYFSGSSDFNPGSATNTLTSNGGRDIFQLYLDNNGNYLNAFSMGSTANDAAFDMYQNSAGNIYTTGYFGGSMDFDPSSSTSTFTNFGNSDVYTQKTFQCIPSAATQTITSCGSYTWIDGNTYTTSNNTATHTLVNAAGCDSIITLNLTINATSNTIDVINACNSYTWIDGNTYTASNNSATHTLTNSAGCDSIVTLDLTILQSTTATDAVTACDSYTWIDGNTYTSSNNSATDTLVNSVGCDSIVTLDLTILYSTAFTDVITACDTFTWIDGNTYSSSNNTATHTLTNAVGCDSLVTLDLTILNSTYHTDVITACDSYTWIDGNTYTTSNNLAVDTLTNAVGCDSIVTLNLTILNSTTYTDIITACDNYTWIDGNTYTASNNTATHTLTNSVGCDSVVTLDLTVNYTTTYTDVQTACYSYTWIDGVTYYSNNNFATHTLTNVLGCDSIVTLDLSILNTYYTDIITACDSYTWIDGNTYTASNNTAVDTLVNSAGCDSVVFLDLTINYSSSYTDVISACDSYTWIDGNTYTTSNNTATHTLTNAVGCDSIVTLDLTMNYSTSYTDVITACDNYMWIDGATYTSSNNTATHTLTNSVGCDSVVTLDLTILNSTTYTDVISACESYTWIDGNTYFTSNNTATYVVTNSIGCDSIIQLDLTINRAYNLVDEVYACNSYTWVDGVTYTSSNNTAVVNLTSQYGCDSTVTLNLTLGTLEVTTQFVANQTLEASVVGNYDRFEWVSCLDNGGYASVVGDTFSTFTPEFSGEYAVMVFNDEGCIDTSDCKSIIGTGIETGFLSNSISLYPNPNSGEFTVQFENQVDDVTVTIYSINGQEVYRKQARSTSMVDVQFEGARGLYMCRISLANGESKLVKLVVD